MPKTLDAFADTTCAELLSCGGDSPTLEAQTADRVYALVLANMPPNANLQREVFALGARFGADPACADHPLTDLFMSSEAWLRMLAPGEQVGAGSLANDPQRLEVLVVTHTRVETSAVKGRIYLMQRDAAGRLTGLTVREDLQGAVEVTDKLSGSFLAGVQVGRAAPRGSFPPLTSADDRLRTLD
jgi:hypothetical protein